MRKRIAMVLALVMSICSISTVNASTYYMIYCNGQYWEDLKDVRDEIIIPEDNVVSRTVIEVQQDIPILKKEVFLNLLINTQ